MFLFYLHECFKFLERKGFPGSRPRDDDIKTRKVWGDWQELLVNDFLYSSGTSVPDQCMCWFSDSDFILSGSIQIPMMISCVEADPIALQLQTISSGWKSFNFAAQQRTTRNQRFLCYCQLLAISGIWNPFWSLESPSQVPDPLPAASESGNLTGSVYKLFCY